jgi:integrase
MFQTTCAVSTETALPLIMREIVRFEMTRILADWADPAIDIDARLESLTGCAAALRTALRTRSYEAALPKTLAAAERLGLPCPVPLTPEVGTAGTSVQKALADLEIEIISEGVDPLIAARPLLERHEVVPVAGGIPGLVRIGDAVEAACAGQTGEMRRKLRCTGDLAIEFLGDIPLDLLAARAKDLLLEMSRLPKTHGKLHGKNRFTSVGKEVSRREEIAAADAKDAAEIAAVAARTDISEAQKRAILARKLTPRVTQTNLERHLDRLHRILRAAEQDCGYRGPTKLMGYAELDLLLKQDLEGRRAENTLHVRVTQPKLRLRWAGERIARLLTSPLYTGCKSKARRTKPGRMIFRDALYWVPLILLTMGTRVTEVLQLAKRDLILRDGIHCLSLCWTAEQDGKTESAQRIVPIPRLLLDLGFVEWILGIDGDPDALLFPEIMSVNAESPEVIFTKRFRTVRQGLGIIDCNEDLYALRKTLSSALWRGGVSVQDRMIIIGHASDTTIGRHYTDADMPTLKALLDRADHRLTTTTTTAHHFPIIAGCSLVSGERADVEVLLDETGHLGALRVIESGSGILLLSLEVRTATLPASPDWPGLQTVPRRLAANMVADLLGSHHLVPPPGAAERRAWEHLLAHAARSSEVRTQEEGRE